MHLPSLVCGDMLISIVVFFLEVNFILLNFDLWDRTNFVHTSAFICMSRLECIGICRRHLIINIIIKIIVLIISIYFV